MINIKDKLLNTTLSISLGVVFLPIAFSIIFIISSWGLITGLIAINVILIYLSIVFIKSGLHFLWNMVTWAIEPDPELELIKYQIDEEDKEGYFAPQQIAVTSPQGKQWKKTLSEFVEDIIIERRYLLKNRLLKDRALTRSPEPLIEDR